MSGETEKDISGWTVDTLKVYVESRLNQIAAEMEVQKVAYSNYIDAVRTEMTAAFLSSEKAIAKAESASDRRFESVNEFRAQLTDQATKFMPRAESEARHAAMAEKLAIQQARLDKMEGRGSGLNAGWAYLIAAVGLAAALLSIIFTLRK